MSATSDDMSAPTPAPSPDPPALEDKLALMTLDDAGADGPHAMHTGNSTVYTPATAPPGGPGVPAEQKEGKASPVARLTKEAQRQADIAAMAEETRFLRRHIEDYRAMRSTATPTVQERYAALKAMITKVVRMVSGLGFLLKASTQMGMPEDAVANLRKSCRAMLQELDKSMKFDHKRMWKLCTKHAPLLTAIDLEILKAKYVTTCEAIPNVDRAMIYQYMLVGNKNTYTSHNQMMQATRKETDRLLSTM